jgi:hypothetical protein
LIPQGVPDFLTQTLIDHALLDHALDGNTPDAAYFTQLQLPAAAYPNAKTSPKAQLEICSDKWVQLWQRAAENKSLGR